MKRFSKRLPAALLLLLIAACLWYSRALEPLELQPELEPSQIYAFVQSFGDTAQDVEARTFQLDAASEEGQALLEQLSTYRLRRSLWNPLRVLFSLYTGHGTPFEDGDYAFVLRVFGEDGGWVALQFNIDHWLYDTTNQPQYLPCSLKDGESVGATLAQYLWEIGTPTDSVS